MTNTWQKASDDKDCHTSLLSQGGASDLQAHSLYKTWDNILLCHPQAISAFFTCKNKQKNGKTAQ